MNRVTLFGNFGRDAVVRETKGGMPVANMSVATTERFYQGEGDERKLVERPEWHRVVAWGKLAEVAEKLYKKGKSILIEGRLQTRQWEDDDGVTRYTTEVVASFMRLTEKAPKGANEPPPEAYDDDAAAQSGAEPLPI